MSYSEAISNCWNNSNNPGMASETLRTCYFCSSSVLITSNGNVEENIRTSELLKNMCFHMQINKGEIPESCSKLQFPYCDDCEKLLQILWEYQKMIDNVASKISAIVATIEQTVAHDTLNRNNLTETEQFSNLRELIADGYRKKLLMKKLIRQNIGGTSSHLLQPMFSPMTLIKGESDEPTDESETLSCNLVITNVMSVAAPDCPINIKEEVMQEAESEELNQEESGSDDEVYTVPLRKRRLLFQNVEIYKCVGANGKKCLQCSICSHSVPVPKNGNNGDMTPYMKLKLHIQKEHTNQPACFPRERRAPTFVCLKCNLSFTKIQMYREHKKIHPTMDEPLCCDICGRPIKNNCYRNLLLHQFSHKNDKERMEAIAAGERVTKKTLLSSKLNRRKAFQKRRRNARRVKKQGARGFY